MKTKQIEKAILLLLFISSLLFSCVQCSKSTTGETFKTINGVLRLGTPLKRLLLNNPLYCTISCENLVDCHSFNIISSYNYTTSFLCELFNEETSCSRMQTIPNATYSEVFPPKDCLAKGSYQDDKSSIYSLRLSSGREIQAFCDMNTDRGGWTLLQRRIDGSVDFFRDWQSYKQGFGNLNGEFWLGLDNAHELMKDTNTTLRFDLWDGDEHRFAEYNEANIANELDNYRLTFKGYKGNAGDSMAYHNNQIFTTKDRDNDNHGIYNCAVRCIGAWWYGACHYANLNGKYGDLRNAIGINWRSITNVYRSLSKTEMKIRRSDVNMC